MCKGKHSSPAALPTGRASRKFFGAISEGDDDLGIPPYNGGLFAAEGNSLLSRIKLSDETLAKAILPLSHREEEGRLRYINYRDLSVQQLGSIYESILEYGVEIEETGTVRPRSDNEARHRSGSYYTPEPLVSLIIEKTVGPVVEEKREAFEAWKNDPDRRAFPHGSARGSRPRPAAGPPPCSSASDSRSR